LGVEVKEAAKFYVSAFSGRGDVKIKNLTTIQNTPSGSDREIRAFLSRQKDTRNSCGAPAVCGANDDPIATGINNAKK